jgi:hypothetical protein
VPLADVPPVFGALAGFDGAFGADLLGVFD